MPWFIKSETFTPATACLAADQRRIHLESHRSWVDRERASGRGICSGFLVDEQRRPGGGGLLIFEAESYEAAMAWVKNDPMIRGGLVTWRLQEWILTSGDWPVRVIQTQEAGSSDPLEP